MSTTLVKPLFSVIIPTYNRAIDLERALKSIAEQTFTDYEVIVCDDGSTDDTKDIVSQYLEEFKLNYLWARNWGGPAKPRNRGLKVSAGQWICFLDSDDWWYPGKLAEVFKNIHKGDVVYHDLDVYTAQNKKVANRVRSRRMKVPIINDLMTQNNRIYNSSFSVKKEVLDMVGEISEDRSLIAAEDFDLWIRISMLTDRFYYIPKSLGAYWLGNDNITEISERQISRIRAVHEKHIPGLPRIIKNEATCYMDYSIGRIKQKLGLENEAMDFFKASIKSKRMDMKMKSLICILLNHYLCCRHKNKSD